MFVSCDLRGGGILAVVGQMRSTLGLARGKELRRLESRRLYVLLLILPLVFQLRDYWGDWLS